MLFYPPIKLIIERPLGHKENVEDVQSQNYSQVNSKELEDDAEVPFATEMVETSHDVMLVPPVTYVVQLQEELL